MESIFTSLYDLIGMILPFQWASHEFMKRALIAMVLVAPAAAAMGIHVVNFRMSFYSDAISHSAFTGIALGVVLGFDPLMTMVVFGLVIGLLIVKVRRSSQLSVDTIIGVAFSTAVALGIVLISARRGLTRNLHSFIYGDVLAVREGEVVIMFLLALTLLVYSAWLYNRLILMSINGEVARTRGINTSLQEYIFSLLLALVVCLSIRVVGILLVTALIIVPAAVGRSMARSAGQLFWISTVTALISAIAGLALSYYWDSATGATVVLVCAGFFFIAQLFNSFVRR